MTNFIRYLAIMASLSLLAAPATAGDGRYDATFGIWDFGVSMRFDATQQQLDRTEQEFGKASDLIYDASDGQQEFGDVFVCNKKGAGRAAEVWIFAPGRSWGSQAPGRFGVPGQHIELCYDDMVYSNTRADGSWVVAHEWGHHAYGIKDEYSGPTAGDKECVVVPADVNARTACLIENFWNHGAVGASLTEWCVSSNHDPNADTWQEDINGTSCWESLVAAYPDVTAPTALPDAGPATNPLPLFSWTQLEEGARIVLVIDDSGSMSSDNKMELAKLGGKIFANLARNGQKLGAVRFNSSASMIYPLTVMDDATRAAAKSAIDGLSAGGGTNIDSGLNVAISMITGEGDRSCQQAVVLLSDGSQGGPVGGSVIQALNDNGITVHSIALGPSGVDIPTMQAVAAQTAGKYFYADNGGDLPAIFANLSAVTSEGGVLNTASGTLAPGDTTGVSFDVDETTTQISFVTSWQAGTLGVGLSGPGNTSLDGTTVDPDFSYSQDGSSVSMVVRGGLVAPGVWTVELSGSVDPVVSAIPFEVQALSDSKDLAFQATSDKQSYTWPEPMLLTAQASFDQAITGIDVTGLVKRPDGSTAEVVLRDDGSSASGDVFAGDGMYSGRFDTWSDSGGYTVEIRAVNDGGGVLTGGEGLIPDGEQPVLGEPPPEFSRTSSFSVSLAGAPPLKRFAMAVERFRAAVKSTSDPVRNRHNVRSRINLAYGSVDPATDVLRIEVGGLPDYVFAPEDLKQAGKKPRYVFKDKESGVSGFVDLFRKGTSQGSFSLNDKGFSGFALGSLSSVFLGFEWGDMDESTTLAAHENKKGNATSFNGKKDGYLTEEAWVSAVKVALNTKKQDRDRLSLRAKLSGGGFGAFQPESNDTVITFGPWMHTIGADDWSANKKGTRLTYRTQDRTVTVTYDTERQELAIVARNQSLGSVTPTVQYSVSSGPYVHRREIRMAVNKQGTTFVY